MYLYNAQIFYNNSFIMGSVETQKGVISSVSNCSSTNFYSDTFDCKGNYLIPGLIDIHFHGCVGDDLCDGSDSSIDNIANYQSRVGVTEICPATMTYPEQKLHEVLNVAANYKNENGADLVGINMEGPFISPSKVGAQNPAYVQRPNIEKLYRLQDSARGLIKLVDVAPEEDGCLDLIRKASSDFNFSLAHTCASYDIAKKAFLLGATHLTHTFNAMPGIHHRRPGPIPAAVESGAFIELICDGQHINYATIRLAFNIFNSDKICLISDSCRATGANDGEYMLGGQKIIKKNNVAVLSEAPDTIAASVNNLFDCMKHAYFDANIPLEKAISAATINPARAIGVDDKYGSINVGKIANMVLCDKNLNILKVFLHGKVL